MVAGVGNLEPIRDWLLKQPHLPQTLDDRLLDRFLLSCDSSLERTKAAMEYFFTSRTDCPEFFRDRDPCTPRMQEIFSKMELVPLEGLTTEGYACSYVRFLEKDMETFHLSDYMKAVLMVGDLEIREDIDRVPVGLVAILDATNWSVKLLTKFSLTTFKKFFDYCQEAQPVKARQIHIINPLPFMDSVISILRPLLKSGVLDMIHIHPVGSDTLYQYVSKDILPQELGGYAGTTKDMTERVKRRLEAEREWLMKDEWKADESKRVGKRNGEQHREMTGSFRALSID